jgi:hypothetical protein
MGKKWMPLEEAVVRAGSFETLRPYLREARIFARCTEWRTWPDGGSTKPSDRNIHPTSWNDAHDIDPVAGTAVFRFVLADFGDDKYVTYELLAIGIEVVRAMVEALFPAKPKPPKPPGSKRGPKQSAAWKPLLKHLDAMVKRGKLSNPTEDAFDEARRWLEKNNRSLSDGTLRKGLKRNRPDWFEA